MKYDYDLLISKNSAGGSGQYLLYPCGALDPFQVLGQRWNIVHRNVSFEPPLTRDSSTFHVTDGVEEWVLPAAITLVQRAKV
jgi:hypothetical protein